MPFPSDTRLRALTVLLLVWPALHALLVPALGISTWRLGGWGMYATPNPRRSDVLVVGRDCVFTPRLLERDAGLRGLVLGNGSVQYGALAVDSAAHELARDISAFRWDSRVLALDAQVRRSYGIDASHPLAVAVTQTRIRVATHTAFGVTTVFVVASGSVIKRGHGVASLARFDGLLPACPTRP